MASASRMVSFEYSPERKKLRYSTGASGWQEMDAVERPQNRRCSRPRTIKSTAWKSSAISSLRAKEIAALTAAGADGLGSEAIRGQNSRRSRARYRAAAASRGSTVRISHFRPYSRRYGTVTLPPAAR